MNENIFKSEKEIQSWLSDKLNENDCFKELISNAEEIEQANADSVNKSKVLESYKYCLQSLNLVSVMTENEDISLKKGDVLKPDFLLYAPETQSMLIVEIKHLSNPSRQAGTEVGAYANEIRSYVPFISDGDMVNIIISSVWPTLLSHYVFHEIFWLQRNVLCLKPVKIDNEIKLEIVEISCIAEDTVALRLANEHLGGYRICLYDDELYSGGPRERLDQYIPQMKTAISAMAVKGNAHKNNGFAFLWKDNFHLSAAPYNITIMNIAAFQSLERMFHAKEFEPNEITEKFIDVLQDHDPIGHGYSLEAISKYGEKFLEDICSIRTEGFNSWDVHRRDISTNSELIAFFGWGIFGELHADMLFDKYKLGQFSILPDDPLLGFELIDKLIDPNYDFINLNHYNRDEEDWEDEL